eukprot:scaffold18612_cov118-Isochrysis_galbana.AAC.2
MRSQSGVAHLTKLPPVLGVRKKSTCFVPILRYGGANAFGAERVRLHRQFLISHGRHRRQRSLDAYLAIGDAAAALRCGEQHGIEFLARQLAQPLIQPGYVRNLNRLSGNDANDIVRFVAQLHLVVRHLISQGSKACAGAILLQLGVQAMLACHGFQAGEAAKEWRGP